MSITVSGTNPFEGLRTVLDTDKVRLCQQTDEAPETWFLERQPWLSRMQGESLDADTGGGDAYEAPKWKILDWLS